MALTVTKLTSTSPYVQAQEANLSTLQITDSETRRRLLRALGIELTSRPQTWLALGVLQFWTILLYTESKLIPSVSVPTLATRLPLSVMPLIIVTIAFCAAARRWQRGLMHPVAPIAKRVSPIVLIITCVISMTLGASICCISLLTWNSKGALSHGLLLACGSALLAPGTLCATVGMCTTLGQLGGRAALVHGFTGTLVNTLLICAFHALPQIGQALAFMCSATAVCPATLWSAKTCGHPTQNKRLGPLAQTAESQPLFPTKLAVTSLLQGLSFGTIYLSFPVATAGASAFTSDMAGFIIATFLLFGAVVLWTISYNTLVYNVAFVGISLGYMLLVVFGTSFEPALAIKNAGYVTLDVAIISLSAAMVRDMQLPAPWIALVTSAALSLGQLANFVLVCAARAMDIAPHALYATTSFILMAGALFLTSESNDATGWGLLKPVDAHPEHNGFLRACSALAEKVSLTPRERDVLVLLAVGRNKQAIGHKLGISADTAKTHVANIYRKVGVHSQQELIELIDTL